MFLQNYKEGYASEIAATFSIPLNMVQKQLKRLEAGGVIVGVNKGRMRLFTWNPRYYFRAELQLLLEKALGSLPLKEQTKFYRKRTRPRRFGKPL